MLHVSETFRVLVFMVFIHQVIALCSIWLGCPCRMVFFLTNFLLQFYRILVGIQSPAGITTTRGVLRRFNDFLKLFSDVSENFSLYCLQFNHLMAFEDIVE